MSNLGEAGIVRRARRPAGWKAPGPSPLRDADHPSTIGPRTGEDLCYLTGDWRILQRLDGHRWSLDDLVTAWVAADACKHRPPRRVADLGCGIGAVLLMMAWRFPLARVVGIEAQAVSVDLARRSILYNSVEHRCQVALGDLRDQGGLAERQFDLVTGTPPYLPIGSATESRRVQFGPCHFEHRGGIEAYCSSAARLLRPDGRFVVAAAAGQIGRVHDTITTAGLVIERRLDVIPRAGKGVLFSVYVMRGADVPGFPVIDTLVVRDERGRRTERFCALRRDMGMPP
jgi:tRNA1Val (adenine37-N6)-methyltransferase